MIGVTLRKPSSIEADGLNGALSSLPEGISAGGCVSDMSEPGSSLPGFTSSTVLGFLSVMVFAHYEYLRYASRALDNVI